MSLADKAFKVANSYGPIRSVGWEDLTAYPQIKPDFAADYPGMVGACRMFGCVQHICKTTCKRTMQVAQAA